jgi:hypothetical protein
VSGAPALAWARPRVAWVRAPRRTGGGRGGGARALGPRRADARGPRGVTLRPGGAAGHCARGWGAAAGARSEERGRKSEKP